MYYNKNKEKFAEKNRRWRQDNPERIAEYLKENEDRNKTQGKEWREKNKEKLAEKMREYRNEKPEIIKKAEKNRKRPEGHKEKFNVYHKTWRQNNPDKRDQYYQSRRSRISKGINDLTQADIRGQRELQQGKCYYCKQDLDNKGRGHVEHKIPLSRDGHNTKTNIVIACSKCNLEKGQMTEEEYYEYISNRSR